MAVFLSVFFVSLLSTLAVAKFFKGFTAFLDRPEEKKPQKLQRRSVPRLGWFSVLLSFFLGSLLLKKLLPFKVLLAFLPTLLVGIYEDYRRTTYKVRFLFIFLTALFSVFLLNAEVRTLGFGELPEVLAILFTIFALVGGINAFNIVDGLNGLASGLGIITAVFYLKLSFDLGAVPFVEVSALFLASLLGFWLVNYLKGSVFLGDTGSYFVGFFASLFAVLLAGGSYPSVSPWVAVLFLFYPVVDTLFAIFRRIREGKSPFEPDREHMHHLLFCLFKGSHIKATGVILLFQALLDLFAYLIKGETLKLVFLTLLAVSVYLLAYRFLKGLCEGSK